MVDVVPEAAGERFDDSEDYRYSQRVAVAMRWVVLASWLTLLNYRPEFDGSTLLALNLLALPTIMVNGYVTWRLSRSRPMTALYVYLLSLLDLVVVTTGIAITTGFANTFFVFYYPVLIGFSVVFHRRRVAVGLATLGIGAYVLVSVLTDPGVDFSAGEERNLIARVVSMFGVVVASNLIMRTERLRRMAAVAAARKQAQENFELQQKAMTAEMAVSKERSRIAREIHDGIAQEIYMLGLGLETSVALADREPAKMKERLGSLLPVAKQALLHTRNYLYDLKPLIDGEQGLAELARNQAHEFTTITGISVSVAVEGEERTIPFAQATAIYRMVQESLANVLKHSQATDVQLAITFAPDSVGMRVADNGIGFDQDSHHVGYGLTSMRERAEELGGECDMLTNAGNGTVVTASVPT